MENLYSQQSQSNAEAVTKTHGDSVSQAVQVATEAVSVAVDVAANVTDTTKDNETKAANVTQIAASVLETIPAVVPFAPVIALGVELEPEIYHGISAMIHFFQSRHKAAKATQGK